MSDTFSPLVPPIPPFAGMLLAHLRPAPTIRYLPPGRSDATVTVTPFVATRGLNSAGVTTPVTGYNVSVRIQWRAPNEDDALPAHAYQVLTTIVRNP